MPAPSEEAYPLYAFAVFGYLTAALASYLVHRDADSTDSAVAGEQALRALQAEVAAPRTEIRRLSETVRSEQE